MTTTNESLADEFQRLSEAATPGEWYRDEINLVLGQYPRAFQTHKPFVLRDSWDWFHEGSHTDIAFIACAANNRDRIARALRLLEASEIPTSAAIAAVKEAIEGESETAEVCDGIGSDYSYEEGAKAVIIAFREAVQ